MNSFQLLSNQCSVTDYRLRHTEQVDLRGFEPLTSSVRLRRAPNCATGPKFYPANLRGKAKDILLEAKGTVKQLLFVKTLKSAYATLPCTIVVHLPKDEGIEPHGRHHRFIDLSHHGPARIRPAARAAGSAWTASIK